MGYKQDIVPLRVVIDNIDESGAYTKFVPQVKVRCFASLFILFYLLFYLLQLSHFICESKMCDARRHSSCIQFELANLH